MDTTDKQTLESIIKQAFLRGILWMRENPTAQNYEPYCQKAASDYAHQHEVPEVLTDARDLFREKPQDADRRNLDMANRLDAFLS